MIEEINLVIVFDLGWQLDLKDPLRSDLQIPIPHKFIRIVLLESLSSRYFVFVFDFVFCWCFYNVW